jgi:hypothetical protein
MQIFTPGYYRPAMLLLISLLLVGLSWILVPHAASQHHDITIIDSWVIDGFEFHVGFEAPPSNAFCPLYGEGLIEFEVDFFTPATIERESVFGVATWFPASDPDETIETYAEVIGPQGLCTNASPCRIRDIRIVKTFCPPDEGPLYPPSWF